MGLKGRGENTNTYDTFKFILKSNSTDHSVMVSSNRCRKELLDRK